MCVPVCIGDGFSGLWRSVLTRCHGLADTSEVLTTALAQLCSTWHALVYRWFADSVKTLFWKSDVRFLSTGQQTTELHSYADFCLFDLITSLPESYDDKDNLHAIIYISSCTFVSSQMCMKANARHPAGSSRFTLATGIWREARAQKKTHSDCHAAHNVSQWCR